MTKCASKVVLVSQRRFTKFGTPSDGSWADRSYTAGANVSTLTGNVHILTRGNKQYELSNHLGNVLVTVQDRKRSKDNNADNMADYYLPYLRTVSDYYAFGSPIYGRGGAIQKCSVIQVPDTMAVLDTATFSTSSTQGFTAATVGVTVSVVSGTLKVESPSAYRPKTNRSVALINGKAYTLKFKLTNISSGGYTHNVRVRVLLPSATITNNYSSTGTKTITFTSNTTGGVIIEYQSVISGGSASFYQFNLDSFKLAHDSIFTVNTNLCNVDKDYRYGFQEQEKDNEVKSNGDVINFNYRMNDTRLGRFFSVDPLAIEFPWNSVYAFSENRVLDCVELEGLEAVSVNLQQADGVTFNVYVKNASSTTISITTNVILYNVDAAGNPTPDRPLTNGLFTPSTSQSVMSNDANNAINGTSVQTRNDINNNIIPATPAQNTTMGAGGAVINQFNNLQFLSPPTGTVPGVMSPAANFTGAVTNAINQTGVPAALFPVIPANTTKLIIVTNGTAISNANALALIGTPANATTGAAATGLMAAFPGVQFSVISDPLSGLNNDQNLIIQNPTANFIAPGAGVINLGATTLLPFTNNNGMSTTILPSAPIPFINQPTSNQF